MSNKSKSAQKSETNPVQKKKGKGKKKIIIIATVIVVVAALLSVGLVTVFGKSPIDVTTVTTHNVEEITYGDVNTTISGSGTLSPVNSKTITANYMAEVGSVNVTAGDEVEEGDVLMTLIDDKDETEEITAPFDGVVLEVSVSEGDETIMQDSLAVVMSKEGYTISLSVDELDIASVEMDQEVSVTLDAVDGEYTGTVTSISYNGTSNGSVTTYQILATIDHIDGVFPGMTAAAEIIIESSGDGLLVPVDAIRTSGDDSYVYLAPSGAEAGTEYAEDGLDITDLTKVTVDTGMSDGSYIMLESDELEEGSLIIITKLTSTLTGSDSDSENGFGMMGGMRGMDFGDIDMENMPNFGEGGGPNGNGGAMPNNQQ